MRRIGRVALLGGLVMSLIGCTSDGTANAPDRSATTTTIDSSAKTGFTAQLVGGGSVVLADELSTKPVALWFWAPG